MSVIKFSLSKEISEPLEIHREALKAALSKARRSEANAADVEAQIASLADQIRTAEAELDSSDGKAAAGLAGKREQLSAAQRQLRELDAKRPAAVDSDALLKLMNAGTAAIRPAALVVMDAYLEAIVAAMIPFCPSPEVAKGYAGTLPAAKQFGLTLHAPTIVVLTTLEPAARRLALIEKFLSGSINFDYNSAQS